MKISAVLCFRVHVWGACGRWFESSHPDKFKRKVSVKTAETFFVAMRGANRFAVRVFATKILHSRSHRILQSRQGALQERRRAAANSVALKKTSIANRLSRFFLFAIIDADYQMIFSSAGISLSILDMLYPLSSIYLSTPSQNLV